MDRASDGAVFLRAKYQDKDNVWHYEDSEQLKSTTTDFIHLHKTFTLPADIVKTSVRVYLVAMHTICTVYGDMAQLETGSTVSRCNLVDNGDFHLGTTSGFTKTGSFEDGLTSVGTSNIIPVQSAIVVSAAKSTVYATPSLNGTKVVEVTKGTHLYALCYEKMKISTGTRYVLRQESGDIFMVVMQLRIWEAIQETIRQWLEFPVRFYDLQHRTAEAL